MRHFLLSYSVLAAFSSLGAAAPKFAFNRADFVPKSHSPKAHHTTITNPPRATVSHASLELRDPAVEHMIDAVRPNSQSTIASVSVSVSASAVSQACEPFITLEARVPAVNRINAVGSHAVRASPGARAPCPVLSGSSSFLEAAERLEPRDPAVNRIDAVGQDTIGQSVLSLAGGSPVTLDAGEILELDAAATEQATAAATIPIISANPTANAGFPVTYSALPSATASSTGVRFEVPNTTTTLYLYYHKDQVIPKTALGEVLTEAILVIRQRIIMDGKDHWIPTDEWSYVRQKWDCIVICDANTFPGPSGKKQHLTYGILHSTMAGLWGALISKGNYFGADFDIHDGDWGKVGSGTITPWQK